jgi:hypothetical protein
MATVPRVPSAEKNEPMPFSTRSSRNLPVRVDNLACAESDMYFSQLFRSHTILLTTCREGPTLGGLPALVDVNQQRPKS